MSKTRSYSVLGGLTALALALTTSNVSAETLLMPKRDVQKTPTAEVVWGITTLPNGVATSFTFNFGDGTPNATGTLDAAGGSLGGRNRHYIAVTHQFVPTGLPLTVTLTVVNGATTEVATTTVVVFDQAVVPPEQLRGLNINRAIQNGLRYLWTTQANLTNFDTTSTTWWGNGGQIRSMSSLVTLAFENQGYHVPNAIPCPGAGCADPTGLYEKYVVQRGLNWVMDQLTNFTTGPTAVNGFNACVGGGGTTGFPAITGPTCVSLQQNAENAGYATGISLMSLAGAQAPLRVTRAGLGGPTPGNGSNVAGRNAGFVAGKTYGEILQRTVNGFAWGQTDCGTGRGGWYYGFDNNCGTSDGSTMGWAFSGLIDAAGSGATMPTFVKDEITNFLLVNNALNNDGTYDYQSDGTAASHNTVNPAKTGTALLALFYSGNISGGAYPTGNPKVDASVGYINARWAGNYLGDDYTGTCSGASNKGCAYAMFNIFKGLKAQGVTTLPGVGRAAGPGSIPANDWYADYEDYLVGSQSTPTTLAGGQWDIQFSCCYGDTQGETAIAELILAPTAFVLPDTLVLSPATDTNPIGPTVSHTVTAHVTNNGQPLGGVTVTFVITSGPNSPKTGTGVANGAGDATFTYFDLGGGGTDHIVANVGSVTSNEAIKIWSNADCSTVRMSTDVLPYPMDHGMRTVNILNTPPNFQVTAICQDENPDFEGIPAYAQDGAIAGPTSIQLRGEFSGNRATPSNGRVYRIFYQDLGLQCTGQRTVIFATTPGGTTAGDGGPLFNSIAGGACPQQ